MTDTLRRLALALRSALEEGAIDASVVEPLITYVNAHHGVDLLALEEPTSGDLALEAAMKAASSINIAAHKQKRGLVGSTDGKILFRGYKSKRHESPSERYWFSVLTPQLEPLRGAERAWLAFGCGSIDQVLMVPLAQFDLWAEDLPPASTGSGWHVHIERRGEGLVLRLRGRGHDVPVDEFLIGS